MKIDQPDSPTANEPSEPETPSADRQPWEPPKLGFVEPKLDEHGPLDRLTRMPNGFFGQFSP